VIHCRLDDLSSTPMRSDSRGQSKKNACVVDLNRIVEYVCEGMQLTEQGLRAAGKERRASKARALVGWLVFATRCATLSEGARRFNRDLSGIGRGVSMLERTAREGGTTALALRAHMMSISQA
jgi:hypothetical protein